MEEGADGYCDNGSGARQWQGRGGGDVGELSEVGEGPAIFSTQSPDTKSTALVAQLYCAP